MPIKDTQIVDADEGELISLEIPFMVMNGDGKPHEETLHLKYRPPTEERTMGRTNAQQLADIIAEWNVVDADDNPVPPTYEYFAAKPARYVRRLADAISADYFPKL